MKIAVVRGANLNKYEMQLFEHFKGDHDVIAFTIWRNNFSTKDINLKIKKLVGIESFIPRRLRRYSDFFFNYLLETYQPMLRLSNQLEGFDIVHTAEVNYYYSFQVAQAKERFKYRIVATQAEILPRVYGRRSHAINRIKQTIDSTDMFTPATRKAAELLQLWGVPLSKITVVPFGIDTKVFSPQEKDLVLLNRLGIKENQFVILFVGRMIRIKGVYELVYAAAKLLYNNPKLAESTIFMMVGSGPESTGVLRLLEQLGLRRYFIMLEQQNYLEMPKIYNLCDIFVLPSILTPKCAEQFGIVLLESMACGKPIIATRVGGIPEVVGDIALLAEPNDHISLANRWEELLTNVSLQKKLGAAGRKRAVEYFDVNIVAQQLKNVYEELLD